jgi:FixJ family two-component response regulator
MVQPDQTSIVYIVDDDPSVRGALARLLRSAGLETREFASGDEFMDAGIGSGKSCVVAEALMPGGAGIDLPLRLRQSGRDIPVVLLTAEGNGQSRAAARSAGAFSFFRKPVDAEAFLDAVEWALGDSPMRRQGPAHTT